MYPLRVALIPSRPSLLSPSIHPPSPQCVSRRSCPPFPTCPPSYCLAKGRNAGEKKNLSVSSLSRMYSPPHRTNPQSSVSSLALHPSSVSAMCILTFLPPFSSFPPFYFLAKGPRPCA